MDMAVQKRPRLAYSRTAGDSRHEGAASVTAKSAAAELAAAGDVRGLLLLEAGLHAVLARADAECVKVVGFLRRESTCERLVHELLLSGITASSDSERNTGATASSSLGSTEAEQLASLAATEPGRAAFAASCVLGGGVPEVAATLATSTTVWRCLVAALRREQASSSVRALSASMLERTCRSFFLRAGSKAREGFVVMAKRHDLLRVILNRQGETPQLISLLPLIYRHDHSSKRYAYWASLEVGMQLTCRVLTAPPAEPTETSAVAAAALLEGEYACEALVGMCEWSAGDRSRAARMPMGATSSPDARQWGLSLLAELTEGSHVFADHETAHPETVHTTIGERLVELAARDCTFNSARQRPALLGVRSLTAVLGVSASLKQPSSAHSHPAIAVVKSVATAIPGMVASLDRLLKMDQIVGVDGEGPNCRGCTEILVQTVRCVGAASDMVASCACAVATSSVAFEPANEHSKATQAIEPLRTALMRSHAPTVLLRLLLGAVGGTLTAPYIVAALKHVWAAPTVRSELFAVDDWWRHWCLPLVERAQLHGSAQGDDDGTETEVLPSFGHIVTISCLCDEHGTTLEAAVIEHLTQAASNVAADNSAKDGTGEIADRITIWRKHMADVLGACELQAAADLKLAKLKQQLKQQKRDAEQQQWQTLESGKSRSSEAQVHFGVRIKRMPMAD